MNISERHFVTTLGWRLLAVGIIAVISSQSASAQPTNPAPSPKIEQLLDLLGDREVQEWLEAQKALPPIAATPASTESPPHLSFAAFFTRFRNHVAELIAAIPRFPAEVAAAVRSISGEMNARGPFAILALIVVFIGAGLVAQWVYLRVSRRWRERIGEMHSDTVRERLIGIAARFGLSIGHVMVFALGSLGAFLIFDWPPLLREIVVGYLVAVLMFRLARVTLDLLLAPADLAITHNAERFRIIPVAGDVAAFWTKRISYAVGWFALGWLAIRLLAELGVSQPSRQLIAYALGLVLLGIGIEAVWRNPGGSVPLPADHKRWNNARNCMRSACFLALWLLWIAGAMRLFWLAVVAIGLPGGAFIARKAVNHVLRRAGTEQSGSETPSVLAAIVERGIRALLIIATILTLAWAWDVDLTIMAANDTFVMRLIRGLFSAAVIALVADFIWHIGKTIIDGRIAEASKPGETGSEEARRQARIRTLLPILRNVLLS